MRKRLHVVTWLFVALIVSTGAHAEPNGKLSAEAPVTIQLDNKGSIEALINALPGAGNSSQLHFLPRRVIKRFTISLSAREALAAMDAGLLTSSQYVDILLERIEAHTELNAFIYIDPETPRAAADPLNTC